VNRVGLGRDPRISRRCHRWRSCRGRRRSVPTGSRSSTATPHHASGFSRALAPARRTPRRPRHRRGRHRLGGVAERARDAGGPPRRAHAGRRAV